MAWEMESLSMWGYIPADLADWANLPASRTPGSAEEVFSIRGLKFLQASGALGLSGPNVTYIQFTLRATNSFPAHLISFFKFTRYRCSFRFIKG